MPNTSKYLIAEQILFRIYGGVPDTGAPIQYDDVYKAIEQKVNSLFKLRQFDVTLPSGETIPENSMIATYTGNTVTSLGNGKAQVSLPITPISLPKSVGIFLVYDPNNPDMPFIPIQRGQGSLLKADALLNDLGGQVGYEPTNNKLIFTKDITQFGITNVTMELCVFDISKYSETDYLPIPAEYEQIIIDEVLAAFAPVTPESGLVDLYTNANQKSQ